MDNQHPFKHLPNAFCAAVSRRPRTGRPIELWIEPMERPYCTGAYRILLVVPTPHGRRIRLVSDFLVRHRARRTRAVDRQLEAHPELHRWWTDYHGSSERE